jgi:hypothetical protein
MRITQVEYIMCIIMEFMCNIGCVATMHHNKSDDKSERNFWQTKVHGLRLVLQKQCTALEGTSIVSTEFVAHPASHCRR